MSDWPEGEPSKEWAEGQSAEAPVQPKKKRPKSRTQKWLGYVFSFLLGVLVFIGLPAAVTAMAPVSRVTFERVAGQVNAHAKTCLLFFVPYRSRTIESVDHIDTRFVAGEYGHDSGRSRSNQTKSEDQGFLVIKSKDQSIEVPVSPINLKSVSNQAQEFLDKSEEAQLRLFVVANWKFSVLAGGALSLLTVLYLVCLSADLGIKLIHVLQWAAGVSPERRFLAAWVRKMNKGA